MLWGYLRSWLKGLPRYDDLEFRRFLRSYQHACLRMGKRAATARVEAERAHLWHASAPGVRSDEGGDEAHRKGRTAGPLLRHRDDGSRGGALPRAVPRARAPPTRS